MSDSSNHSESDGIAEADKVEAVSRSDPSSLTKNQRKNAKKRAKAKSKKSTQIESNDNIQNDLKVDASGNYHNDEKRERQLEAVLMATSLTESVELVPVLLHGITTMSAMYWQKDYPGKTIKFEKNVQQFVYIIGAILELTNEFKQNKYLITSPFILKVHQYSYHFGICPADMSLSEFQMLQDCKGIYRQKDGMVVFNTHRSISDVEQKLLLECRSHEQRAIVVASFGDGGAFVPIQAKNIVVETSKIINDLNQSIILFTQSTDKKAESLLSALANFMLKFGKIHPFYDGNGRVSRILVNMILQSCGQVGILFGDEPDYMASFNDASKMIIYLKQHQKSELIIPKSYMNKVNNIRVSDVKMDNEKMDALAVLLYWYCNH